MRGLGHTGIRASNGVAAGPGHDLPTEGVWPGPTRRQGRRVSPRSLLAGLPLRPSQQGHALHVVGHGERVEGSQFVQSITVLAEDRHVTGEGGRITGHVDHAVRTGCRHGLHHDPTGSLTRRIEHHHLWRIGTLPQHVFHLTAPPTHLPHPGEILPAVGHRPTSQLHGEHPPLRPHLLGESDANSPTPA